MLYAPELLLQTTMTGQLALLMLIESLELNGIQVVSANTDGIVILCDRAKEDLLEELAFDWMLSTSYDLERTDYARIASRDVNNYVAVKLDGKTKGKGVFADIGLSKNPDELIVYKAVAACIAKDVNVEQTIKQSTDINDFVIVRRVEGGAIWNGEYLGKAVRFYHSKTVPVNIVIEYAKNTNKVPNSQGCKPLMNYADSFPSDVDFDYYIAKANELLTAVGYV
jgi:DNA polymerase elongation subunit (family B)